MKKISNWSIRRKVRAGCIVLACILFFSSAISIFEYKRVNSYVSALVADNIGSIRAAHGLMTEADSYNLRLLYGINSNDIDASFIRDSDLMNDFSNLIDSFVTPQEKCAADSVRFAYAAYMQVVNEAPRVWLNGPSIRREWYYSRLQPVYVKLNVYIQQLTFASQGTLISNSESLQDGYYRGMMPALLSVICGMLLVLLFYYYIRYYITTPLEKILKGLDEYRQHGIKYDVRIDSYDELSSINDSMKDILDLNQSYKKQLRQ